MRQEFIDWVSRTQLTLEQLKAADAVARWLYMLENGCDRPDVREYAAEAAAKLRRLLANAPRQPHDDA